MSTDRPATEPRTEAGKALLADLLRGVTFVMAWDENGKPMPDYATPRILAIEAEAAQGAAPLPIGHTTNGDIPNEQQRILPAVQGAAPRAEGPRYEQINGVTYERTPDGKLRLPGAAPLAEGLDVIRKAHAFIGGITPDEWATIDKAREAKQHLDALDSLLSHPSDERVPESEEPR